MNKGKITLLIIALLLVTSFVSASYYEDEMISKSYTKNYETWTYTEDRHGKNRGFTLVHTWSSPTYRYERSENIYDLPYQYTGGSNYRPYDGYRRTSWDAPSYTDSPALGYGFDLYGNKYSRSRDYSGYRRNYW